MLLFTLHYQSELVDPSKKELQGLPPAEKGRELAKTLPEHLSGVFRPGEYKGTFKEELVELVRRKVEENSFPLPERRGRFHTA